MLEPVRAALLVFHPRLSKKPPTICDNCLYGHFEPCGDPSLCRCICHEELREAA